MANLYFIRSNGEKRLVRLHINPDKATGYINEYIKKLNPNFTIYYYRTWQEDGGTMYDVGSHTEFFWVGEEN